MAGIGYTDVTLSDPYRQSSLPLPDNIHVKDSPCGLAWMGGMMLKSGTMVGSKYWAWRDASTAFPAG